MPPFYIPVGIFLQAFYLLGGYFLNDFTGRPHDQGIVRNNLALNNQGISSDQTVVANLGAVQDDAADADQAAIQSAAESNEDVARHLDGKQLVKVIVVPGRLVNFVVKG